MSPKDCHGLHYNRCESSEDQDREAARVQRMYVGAAGETASTCNSLHSKGSRSNFVSKAPATQQQSQPQQQPGSAPGSVKSVGGESGRRSIGERFLTSTKQIEGQMCLGIKPIKPTTKVLSEGCLQLSAFNRSPPNCAFF